MFRIHSHSLIKPLCIILLKLSKRLDNMLTQALVNVRDEHAALDVHLLCGFDFVLSVRREPLIDETVVICTETSSRTLMVLGLKVSDKQIQCELG